MFGGNSTWGQNNQQQQPQQQQGGGLFGGGGFGQQQQQPQQAAGGFGQTGGFGQPAQQQPQQGGGLFGAAPTTSTFGGFGATTQQQPQQTNAFGARPAFGATGSTFGGTSTGGGLFGSTTTPTFGQQQQQPATSGGLFGKPATTSTFGSGATSTLFGAKPATNPFGGQPQQSQDVNKVMPYNPGPYAPPPATGTADPLYFPSWQQDPSATSASAPPHLFHHIVAMEPYKGASADELRAMDYQQNRKHPTQAQPATNTFGQTTGGFGQPQQQTNTFGQPAAASSSTFGAPKPGGLFGSTSTGFGGTTGGFGQTSTNTGGGLFGQPQQQQPQSTGFGAGTTTGGGLFGQPAQAQTGTTGGGLFGNTTPFGQNTQSQPASASSFGGFGAAKPAFGATGTTGTGFGQTNTATTTFGQPAQSTGTTGFGGFGQTQQNQPAQTGGGLFGGGGFGAQPNAQQPAGGGLFGQTTQQPAQGTTGGLFGSTAAKPGGLFGSTTTPAAPAGNTFGGFGQTNNTAQPAATGSLFGNTAAPTTGGGLFGQPQQQQNQQQPASGGLFGNTTGGGLFGAKPATTAPTGGLFGATQPAQQPAQTGSLFGNTAGTSSLFGGQNSTLGQQNQQQNKPAGGLFGGGSLFGNQNQQQQQPGATGGLFGNLGQSQPASTSMFGQQPQQQQQNGLGGSLFGGGLNQSTNMQQQQPTLTASIDQNPYGRNDLFTYSGQKLELGSQTKKPALPPLTASSFRITPSKSQLGKLRGFASPLASSQSPRAGSPALSSSYSGLLNSPSDRYKGLTDAALSPNAFVPRASIKKLTLTPKANGFSNGEDKLESVLGKSALKSSASQNGLATPNRNDSSSPGPMTFNPPPSSRTEESPRRNGALDSSTRVAASERQPKKGEYWCKPKLEKLRQMGQRDLSSLPNFTAGRRGYGEVTFLEPVDLTEVDLNDLLGSIIVFTEMELSVYPDDYKDKPARGEGLNVPAQVSLENCFPKDKATKEPITDMGDPRHARFLKRVKSIPETEFVSYTDDGIWTFKVKHFSRYGLRDSDDESEGTAEATPKKAAYARSASGTDSAEDDLLPPNKGLHDRDSDEDEDTGMDEEEYTDREGSSEDMESDLPSEELEAEEGDGDRWDEPIKSKLGEEGMRKLREMQSSFFGRQVEKFGLYEEKNRNEQAALLRTKRMLEERHQQSGSGFGDAGGDDDALDARAVKRSSFGAPSSPTKLRQPRKYAKVPLSGSIAKGNEGVRADAGLALGRSFRCSWGPNGELVHFGLICAPKADYTASPDALVHIEQVELLADEGKVESMRSERLLSLHLSHSSMDDTDGTPSATLSTRTRFHHFSHLFDGGDRSHEANLWRLGCALFDEIDLRLPSDSPEELVIRISQIRRKLAVSKWLENAVAPAVDSDLLSNGDNQAAKVFSLLSGNQLDRAVQAALDGGDMRLATLISQIGGSEVFKEEVMRQLEDWQKYKANSLISTEYRRLYALLAGITDISPGDKSRGSDGCPDVLISAGLDWKRAFGLRLWFGNPFEDTLTEVFDTYTQSLSSSTPPAKPLPPYLEKPSANTKTWRIPTEPTDILYQLIRLYSDPTISLEHVLSPRNTSPSPTDMRSCWHLYMLLSRVLGKRDFQDRNEADGYSALADGLTQGYAMQLEQGGQWTWAAFVLTHLETPDGRKNALKALLQRHPSPTTEDTEFLTQTLKVPYEWIHEAAAAQFASDGDKYSEYHALIKAELYDRAHDILVKNLAPEAILREDLGLLRRMCEEVGARASGWEYGGKVLLDYVDLVERVPTIVSKADDTGALDILAKSLPRVIQLLPALFSDKNDVQQVACLSDMLAVLYGLADILYRNRCMQRPAITASTGMVLKDRLAVLQDGAVDMFDRALEGLVKA